MITVRLPVELEQQLILFAQHHQMSKSDVIKEALERILLEEQSQKDAYTLGESYFGRYQSGDGTLSVTCKEKLKRKLHAKYDSH